MDQYQITLHGTISPYYISEEYVNYFLTKADKKPVLVNISSLGGDVNEALKISKLFENHGDVTVEFIGFNASAATWAAFGAKKIIAQNDAMWLAHKAQIAVNIYQNMNSDQIQQVINDLQNKKASAEAISNMIAQKYIDRTGKDSKDIINLMNESRWMSAAEAAQWGFVDEVIPSQKKKEAVSSNLIEDLKALGLPVPPVNEEYSILDFIKEGFTEIKNLFVNNDQHQFQTQTIMHTELQFVNQVLNVTGVEENAGNVTLTFEQIKAINAAIETANNAKATAETNLATANAAKATAETNLATANTAKTTAENSLTQAINAIDALHADVKTAEGIDNKTAAIKNLLSKMPALPPAGGIGDPSVNKFREIATDPANSTTDY